MQWQNVGKTESVARKSGSVVVKKLDGIISLHKIKEKLFINYINMLRHKTGQNVFYYE